jgi:polyvinyl alcohol dehydrogenase (cytochrome)
LFASDHIQRRQVAADFRIEVGIAHCTKASAITGAVFSGSMDGHLRAFAAADGKLLWDFDTAKPFTTVNGLSAKGGSLDGAGPIIVGGMLFVNSGYPRFGGMPGNVLLAFAVPEAAR